MGRAEFRRKMKSDKKAKSVTYNLTKAQLDSMVKERISKELDKVKQQATREAVDTVFLLLLALPLKVLMNHYWKKTYIRKMPQFVNYVLEYYAMWQDGLLDSEELKEELWKYAGVRFEEEGDDRYFNKN